MSTPAMLMDTDPGTAINYILLDNLAIVPIGGTDRVFGGHFMTASSDPASYQGSVTESKALRSLSQDPHLKGIVPQRRQISAADLSTFLKKGGLKDSEVLLAATWQGDKYTLLTADKAKIIERVPHGKRVPLLTDLV